jgi:hypothetical protein
MTAMTKPDPGRSLKAFAGHARIKGVSQHLCCQRIEFVEAVKDQDGDVHGADMSTHRDPGCCSTGSRPLYLIAAQGAKGISAVFSGLGRLVQGRDHGCPRVEATTMRTAVTWRAVAGWAVVLSLAGCGDSDVDQRDALHVAVCASDDLTCQMWAAATAVRSCQGMPAGPEIYMDDLNDAQLRHELHRSGAWDAGNWIEVEKCE